MGRELDKTLAETLAKYHPSPKSAIWDCRGKWVARHEAVEFMAARAGIRFGMPTILEATGERKTVAMIVPATLGEVTDWATGEAAPANNKNSYPYAMAEKRARDRVAIKLLGLYGLYSEDEGEDFKAPASELARDPEPSSDQLYLESARAKIKAFKTKEALAEWWSAEKENRHQLLSGEQRDALIKEATARRDALTSQSDIREAAE